MHKINKNIKYVLKKQELIFLEYNLDKLMTRWKRQNLKHFKQPYKTIWR